MKPTKELIRALREAAQALRHQTVHYQWTDNAACNCGVLAQFALGICQLELERVLDKSGHGGVWRIDAHIEYERCAATGCYLPEIYRRLAAIGLDDPKDFDRIERCDGGYHEDPIAVARFFSDLADDLERQRALGYTE